MATNYYTSANGTFSITITTDSTSITVYLSSSDSVPRYYNIQVGGQSYSTPDATASVNAPFTGLATNTGYEVYISCRNGDYFRSFEKTESGGGSGGGTSGGTDIGEQITYKDWSTGSTLWGEENHASGELYSPSLGMWINSSSKAVVPGFSWNAGWSDAEQVVRTVYAKAAVGLYCTSYTVTDDDVTYVMSTRMRMRLYSYPWHGIKVTYTDDTDITQTYLDCEPNWDTGEHRNNSWSGTGPGDTYQWINCTNDWARQSVSLTFKRQATDVDRTVTIQLYNLKGTPTNQSNVMNKFKNTLVVTLPVPKIDKVTLTAEAQSGGTATVNNASSVEVNLNTQVTFLAAPSTGYIFTGWYNGLTHITDTNPYIFNATSSLTLTAHFEYIANKAIYLYEPVTDTAYQLLDSEAVRLDDVSGSVTAGRIARFRNAPNKIWSGYTLTYASTLPAVSNGSIYAVNSESNRPAETYPNETSWTYGSSADYGGGDLIRAAMKVVYQSETPTTLTIRVYCTLSQNAAYLNNNTCNIHWTYTENGVDMTPYNGNPNLSSSDFKYTNYTSTTGWSAYFTAINTWCNLIDNVNNASAARPATSSSTPCNWYKDVVIPKTNSVQSFVFKTTVGSGYSSETSSVTKTITVPAAGYKACVDHSGSHKQGQPYVLHNGSWKQATMYVFDGTQWVKSHYY